MGVTRLAVAGAAAAGPKGSRSTAPVAQSHGGPRRNRPARRHRPWTRGLLRPPAPSESPTRLGQRPSPQSAGGPRNGEMPVVDFSSSDRFQGCLSAGSAPEPWC